MKAPATPTLTIREIQDAVFFYMGIPFEEYYDIRRATGEELKAQAIFTYEALKAGYQQEELAELLGGRTRQSIDHLRKIYEKKCRLSFIFNKTAKGVAGLIKETIESNKTHQQ